MKLSKEQIKREKKGLIIDIAITSAYIAILLIIFIIFYNLTS